jgi:hypothetical protein
MSIRMNDALRDRLTKMVYERVTFPNLESAERAAYEAAEPLVRAAVEAKYPVRDMEVMARYGAASVDDCIKIQLTAGGVEQFAFDTGTGPLVAQKTYYGAIYLADAATTEAVLSWVEARDAWQTAKNAAYKDYRALIANARTLEEVAEVWPEAAEVGRLARSQALTVLSQETVARIREDVRRRTREEE